MTRSSATHMACSVAVALGLIAVAAGCSDSDDGSEPTPSAAATRAPATAASTPESNATVSGATIEVQGVVGAVDARRGTIEIRATGGSAITTIQLAPGAEITRPNGAAIQLADVRPSDRVVASGVVGAEPEILVADAVTAQQVVPGGPPGSNPGG